MSGGGVYWREGEARVLDYSVNIKGGKALLSLKAEITDLDEMPYIVRQLERQMTPKKPDKPKKPLMIEDMRGRHDD